MFNGFEKHISFGNTGIIKRKLLIATLLLCYGVSFPMGQEPETKFKFKQLEEIFSRLQTIAKSIIPASNKNELNSHQSLYRVSTAQSDFIIKIDTAGRAAVHIGLNLFTSDYDRAYNPAVLKFIERALLSCLLEDKDKLKDKLAQDKLVLRLNGELFGTMGFFSVPDVLPVLQKGRAKFNSELNSSQPSSSYYEVVWTDDKSNTVEFRFPARLDLIKGMDKVELENDLYSDLCSPFNNKTFNNKTFNKNPGPDLKNLQAAGDSIYVWQKDKDFYDFTSYVYYFRGKDGYQPVNDPGYRAETLTNYFQLSLFDSNTTVNLSQHFYGDKIKSAVMGMNDLLNYFSADHQIYAGFEKEENGFLPVTLLLVSFPLNYLHLLYVRIPADILADKKSQTIKADLYSFIRFDNTKNIFSDYKDGKGKYIWKVNK